MAFVPEQPFGWLNQSQLLSEIDSDRSQPKSGNDMRVEKQTAAQQFQFIFNQWSTLCRPLCP